MGRAGNFALGGTGWAGPTAASSGGLPSQSTGAVSPHIAAELNKRPLAQARTPARLALVAGEAGDPLAPPGSSAGGSGADCGAHQATAANFA